MVYHGTNAEFTEFDKRKATDKEGKKLNLGWGKGVFYFSKSNLKASRYGKNTMPVFLNISNVYDIKDYENKSDYINALNGYKVGDIWYGEIEDVKNKRAETFVKELKKNKFDGIIYEDEIIVFNSNQIKSATDNVGTFSNNSNDIRFSISSGGGKELTEEERQEIKDDFKIGLKLGSTVDEIREMYVDADEIDISKKDFDDLMSEAQTELGITLAV